MTESAASLPSPAPEQPSQPCAHCGRPGATLVAGEPICDDCYVARGSCCAECFDDQA